MHHNKETKHTCKKHSLSIPFTWDFSMHQLCSAKYLEKIKTFQFPLLGIFPCILNEGMSPKRNMILLSIPFTWDFSMHHVYFTAGCNSYTNLSIPFTWDFSMHRNSWGICKWNTRRLLSIPFTWDFSMHRINKTW